jgi:hypothetical protein
MREQQVAEAGDEHEPVQIDCGEIALLLHGSSVKHQGRRASVISVTGGRAVGFLTSDSVSPTAGRWIEMPAR